MIYLLLSILLVILAITVSVWWLLPLAPFALLYLLGQYLNARHAKRVSRFLGHL